MATLSENVQEAIGVINDYRATIDGTITSLTIPNGTTSIRNHVLSYLTSMSSVFIPNSVALIGQQSFQSSGLVSLIIPASVFSVGWGAFYQCYSLESVEIKNGVRLLNGNVFYQCNNLETLKIPNSITTINSGDFGLCGKLLNVTIENGFNANYLNLSASTLYSAATIVSWLNALADRTGQTAYTLTIGSDNLAKLTAEEIAIATNKNWNLA